MNNKNMILGIVAGVAVLSVAAIFMSKNKKMNWQSLIDSASDLIDGIKEKLSMISEEEPTDHGGRQLAEKARHRAQLTALSHRHN